MILEIKQILNVMLLISNIYRIVTMYIMYTIYSDTKII